MGACGSGRDHFASWHTGHGETLEVILTPCITCLVHHTIVLTIHTLGSGATLDLTEIHDGDLGLGHVDLDAVVRVGHGSLDWYEHSMAQKNRLWGGWWTVVQLAQSGCGCGSVAQTRARRSICSILLSP